MPPRPRATRLTTPSDGAADYADAYEVALPAGESRSPEAWARAVFEDASPVLRGLLRVGWRYVLGLRLAHGSPSDQILGWHLVEHRAGAVVLGLDGPGLASRLTVTVDGSSLSQATRVQLDGSVARARWSVVRPIHRRMVPYLLSRAVRRTGGPRARRRGDR